MEKIVNDKTQAERAADLFSSMSHLLRVNIVRTLYEKGPMSFSGLMKELNAESGALGFHLKQLEAYLARDGNGNYDLSEESKVVLPVLQSFGLIALKKRDRKGRKPLDPSGKATEYKLRRRYLWSMTIHPGNSGIGAGGVLLILGLYFFIRNPGIYPIVFLALGIVAICVGCWVNYKERRTIWEFTSQKESDAESTP